MMESASDNWLERYPLRDHNNSNKLQEALESEDFIKDALKGPFVYQQRFINHLIRRAGWQAFPFLKKLFLLTSDRRLKLFIIDRVSVCFVCVNGVVHQRVYNWLLKAMREMGQDSVLEQIMNTIHERFLDLAIVLGSPRFFKDLNAS